MEKKLNDWRKDKAVEGDGKTNKSIGTKISIAGKNKPRWKKLKVLDKTINPVLLVSAPPIRKLG